MCLKLPSVQLLSAKIHSHEPSQIQDLSVPYHIPPVKHEQYLDKYHGDMVNINRNIVNIKRNMSNALISTMVNNLLPPASVNYTSLPILLFPNPSLFPNSSTFHFNQSDFSHGVKITLFFSSKHFSCTHFVSNIPLSLFWSKADLVLVRPQ